MATFDFYLRQNTDLYNRYDEVPGLRGLREWRGLVEYPSYDSLNEIRKVGKPPLDCPCLFISHRKPDENYARRIAYLATKSDFQFWLDVFDPVLQSLALPNNLSEDQKQWLIAGTIEMGIINSSHVVALITENTLGTLWVPYEYGRITDIPTVYGRACAWRHPDFKSYSPEYLLLGHTVSDENEINDWLYTEMNAWQKHKVLKGSFSRCEGRWTGDEPHRLPGQATMTAKR